LATRAIPPTPAKRALWSTPRTGEGEPDWKSLALRETDLG
jgi:hypothetical protein